jgi:hypothetical protein
MSPETEAALRDKLRVLQDAGWEDDPATDDTLIDDLLASNPAFRAKIAKSKESPRKPFKFGGQG